MPFGKGTYGHQVGRPQKKGQNTKAILSKITKAIKNKKKGGSIGPKLRIR